MDRPTRPAPHGKRHRKFIPGLDPIRTNYSRLREDFITVIGNWNRVEGKECRVIGDNNTVTGERSHVKGKGNIVNGAHSYIKGNDNIIRGRASRFRGMGNVIEAADVEFGRAETSAKPPTKRARTTKESPIIIDSDSDKEEEEAVGTEPFQFIHDEDDDEDMRKAMRMSLMENKKGAVPDIVDEEEDEDEEEDDIEEESAESEEEEEIDEEDEEEEEEEIDEEEEEEEDDEDEGEDIDDDEEDEDEEDDDDSDEYDEGEGEDHARLIEFQRREFLRPAQTARDQGRKAGLLSPHRPFVRHEVEFPERSLSETFAMGDLLVTVWPPGVEVLGCVRVNGKQRRIIRRESGVIINGIMMTRFRVAIAGTLIISAGDMQRDPIYMISGPEPFSLMSSTRARVSYVNESRTIELTPSTFLEDVASFMETRLRASQSTTTTTSITPTAAELEMRMPSEEELNASDCEGPPAPSDEEGEFEQMIIERMRARGREVMA
jgi:hypothetical protein